MVLKVLQINLNNSRRAQDLMTQLTLESNFKLCVISEPAGIVNTVGWFYSNNSRAAIYVPDSSISLYVVLYKKTLNCVSVKFKNLIIISVYISPNVNHITFRSFLDEISDIILQCRGKRILVCGDFNAFSTFWGSAYINRRGDSLMNWASGLNLCLANTGDVPTCVRAQGSSIIDLTWASPSIIHDICNWRVREDLESLSDHQYVSFDIGRVSIGHASNSSSVGRRWNFSKTDNDMFKESLLWICMVNPFRPADMHADPGAWIDRTIFNACLTSTPKIGLRRFKKRTYWWNSNIADLRKNSLNAKRNLTRARTRNHPVGAIERLRKAYKLARRELSKAILVAKRSAWTELLMTIDEDPWGLPYKIVMKKLARGSNLTGVLEESVLNTLLASLFPDALELPCTDWVTRSFRWQDDWAITPSEVVEAIKQKRKLNTAPGPDGIKAIIFKLLIPEFIESLALCFTTCLVRGKFPDAWKIAGLVLIPKQGGVLDGNVPKVRPICLLNEFGKLFERIIASRMNNFMANDNVANLATSQYGFRKAHSTCDALLFVKDLVKDTFNKKEVGIAVGLDIKNAFNSLPWRAIRRALLWRKHFPMYICRIVEDYLSNRWISHRDINGQVCKRGMLASVPQGSVLGPLLWNLTYDRVLRYQTYEGCTVICYADDTLLYVSSRNIGSACELANDQLRRLVPYIEDIGLTIARDKTDAVVFYRREINANYSIRVGNSSVPLSNRMRYLGVF